MGLAVYLLDCSLNILVALIVSIGVISLVSLSAAGQSAEPSLPALGDDKVVRRGLESSRRPHILGLIQRHEFVADHIAYH